MPLLVWFLFFCKGNSSVAVPDEVSDNLAIELIRDTINDLESLSHGLVSSFVEWGADEEILDRIECLIFGEQRAGNETIRDIKISKKLIAVYLAYKDPDITPEYISAIWRRVGTSRVRTNRERNDVEHSKSILDKLNSRTSVPDWYHQYWSQVYDATGASIGEHFEGYVKSLFDHVQANRENFPLLFEDDFLNSNESRMRAMSKIWLMHCIQPLQDSTPGAWITPRDTPSSPCYKCIVRVYPREVYGWRLSTENRQIVYRWLTLAVFNQLNPI